MQSTVTLLSLYAISIASLAALPFNISNDYIQGSTDLVLTQTLYLVLTVSSIIQFWLTRRISTSRSILGAAVLILTTGLILNGGGTYGLGFLYIIAAYTVLFYIVGIWLSIGLPILLTSGILYIIHAESYGPLSFFNNPHFSSAFLLVATIAGFFGITSVIYQHIMLKYLYRAAFIDPVTALPSRNRLDQELSRRMKDPLQYQAFSILGIKIHQFSRINSLQGSGLADSVLKETARRIHRCCSKDDLAIRYSGTVFLIISSRTDFIELDTFGLEVLKTIQEILPLDGRSINLQCSVSITRFPADGNNRDILISNLMSSFARMSRQPGFVSFFDESQHQAEAKRFAITEELHHAVERNELWLAFHPKIKLDSHECGGSEILLRWENRRFGNIGPEIFIPIAEEAGLIRNITRWVLQETISSVASLKTEFGDRVESQVFAINLSPLDLADKIFPELLVSSLESAGLPPQILEFEITEGMMMEENPKIQRSLEAIRSSGCRLAIDDFGTGYSNLGYLHRLKADNLKIDRSFVMQLNESNPESPIIDAIISMAAALHMDITAEGVETPFQEQYLLKKGCTYGQGWHYTKPMRIDDYKAWITKHCMI
ncbi:hypothetical protein JCM12856_18620 [Spirochaeta dissipatitropha]